VSAPSSRLRGIARRPEPRPEEQAEEHCELCSEPVPPGHRHLLDLQSRRLLCACRACSILFDSQGAGGAHFRLLPDRVRLVSGFELDDALWQSLRIPVELAFFFHSSAAERVVAFYPSPMGATESLLELGAWDDLITRNPILAELEPDVEALLVNRTKGAAESWLAPVDRCYALVGLIRMHWRGFGGGPKVWEEVGGFFDALRREARTVTNDGEEATWQGSRSASPT
jgi:hypothetical protein